MSQYAQSRIVDSRMESNERNLFSRRERRPHVDLAQWQQEAVEYTGTRIGVAEEELADYLALHYGVTFDVRHHEGLMNIVLTGVLRQHMDTVDPRVKEGDKVSVTGEFVYDLYTRNGHDMEPRWLTRGFELRGSFQNVSVKDYLDERIFDIDLNQVTDELVAMHVQRFGPHIVLTDPVEVMPDGSEHSLSNCESVFVPLTYHRLALKTYSEPRE